MLFLELDLNQKPQQRDPIKVKANGIEIVYDTFGDQPARISVPFEI